MDALSIQLACLLELMSKVNLLILQFVYQSALHYTIYVIYFYASPTVGSNTPNPILSGSSPTLTCIIELHPAVDIPVHITTAWTRPDGSKLTSAASPVMKSFTHYTPAK